MMKIDVIKLQSRFVNAQSAGAIGLAVERARKRGHDIHFPPDVYGTAMITWGRCQSLRAIRPDSDLVLFTDDDMIPVESAITRLAEHNRPVCSALCTNRKLPLAIAAKRYDVETDTFYEMPELGENVLVSGPFAVGFGFVMLQRTVIDSLVEYVLSGRDWLALQRRTLDRLRVRAEAREEERQRIEKARRVLYGQTGIAPVFQLLMADNQREISEDFHVGRLLAHLGIDVSIDTGCLVGHLGDFPYSPLHLGIKHPTEVSL